MTVKEFKMQYALGALSNNSLQEIAKDPNTSKGILTILSSDEDHIIKSWIASNPNTPIKILTKLYEHGNNGLRWWISKNPGIKIVLEPVKT